MSENFRFVGEVPEEDKEQSQREMQGLLFKHWSHLPDELRDALDESEQEKTEEEIELIKFANAETNKLMKKVGVDPYDIPEENIHFLSAVSYREISGSGTIGVSADDVQAILLNAEKARRNPAFSCALIFHEILHLKGHTAFELKEMEDEEGEYVERNQIRSGVKTISPEAKISSGEYHKHFTGLNEAIVSSQTKKSFEAALALPILKKERRWLESKKAGELKRRVAEVESVNPDEVLWVSEDGQEFVLHPHRFQRRVLSYIVEQIQIDHPDEYKSEEDVFLEFLHAHFSGKLISLAKLIEQSFGKGSFRILGSMTEDQESAILTMEEFKKARIRSLRENQGI